MSETPGAGRGGATTRLLNVALYQLGWFACVAGAGAGRPWAGFAVAATLTSLHVLLAEDRGSEARLVLAFGAVGLVIETLQVQLGLLIFSPAPGAARLPPLWIAGLWLQFATLFHFGLDWLSGRPRLAAGLGLVGGPLAYLAGERLGAVALGAPRLAAIAGLALVWAAVTPALLTLSDRLKSPRAGRYRLRGWRDRG